VLKSIHSHRQERLIALLRQAHEEAGLTQDQLAERMGAYRTFVSKYERGERRLDVVEFMAVTDALGIDPAAILAELSATPKRKR